MGGKFIVVSIIETFRFFFFVNPIAKNMQPDDNSKIIKLKLVFPNMNNKQHKCSLFVWKVREGKSHDRKRSSRKFLAGNSYAFFLVDLHKFVVGCHKQSYLTRSPYARGINVCVILYKCKNTAAIHNTAH